MHDVKSYVKSLMVYQSRLIISCFDIAGHVHAQDLVVTVIVDR